MSKILAPDDLTDKIGLVIGTRPSIVKFSPVVRELQRREQEFVIVHTGQHYSDNMDEQFFSVLDLPEPDYINTSTRKYKRHSAQTAAMMVAVEEALIEARPAAFIVGGDANTNLAAALAVRKLVNINLCHMEAGLRSHDWRMPEEHNRVMIDHISDVLFAPTEATAQNLRDDNVKGEIVVTGNTIVDAVRQNRTLAAERSEILDRLGLVKGEYSVVTVHREENVDQRGVAEDIVQLLLKAAHIMGHELVFPVHPRTKDRLRGFALFGELLQAEKVRLIDPVNYLDMIRLLDYAEMIFTDSGGIQEEACILGRPCITLRDNTERPETVSVGGNKVVGTDIRSLEDAVKEYRGRREYSWDVPYGDGYAARKIVDHVVRYIDDG